MQSDIERVQDELDEKENQLAVQTSREERLMNEV